MQEQDGDDVGAQLGQGALVTAGAGTAGHVLDPGHDRGPGDGGHGDRQGRGAVVLEPHPDIPPLVRGRSLVLGSVLVLGLDAGDLTLQRGVVVPVVPGPTQLQHPLDIEAFHRRSIGVLAEQRVRDPGRLVHHQPAGGLLEGHHQGPGDLAAAQRGQDRGPDHAGVGRDRHQGPGLTDPDPEQDLQLTGHRGLHRHPPGLVRGLGHRPGVLDIALGQQPAGGREHQVLDRHQQRGLQRRRRACHRPHRRQHLPVLRRHRHPDRLGPIRAHLGHQQIHPPRSRLRRQPQPLQAGPRHRHRPRVDPEHRRHHPRPLRPSITLDGPIGPGPVSPLVARFAVRALDHRVEQVLVLVPARDERQQDLFPLLLRLCRHTPHPLR